MTDTPSGAPRILGTLHLEEGNGALQVEDRLPARVEDVWSALTDPTRLAQWYGEVKGSLHVGSEYQAHVLASDWKGTGRIEACEPPRQFTVASKQPDDPSDQITEVTLAAEGEHTVLVVIQRGMPANLVGAYAAGMQIHVEDLASHLAGGERCDAAARWAELQPGYAQLAAELE